MSRDSGLGTRDSEKSPRQIPGFEAPVLGLHLAALALAIGPPVFFALGVAPASFRVLPTRDMAASLQSPILTIACRLAEGSFAVLFLTSWLLSRWWDAPRLARTLATRAAILGMITAVVIESLLIPPMDRIRAEAGLLDTLPATDPSRILLARYHRLATGFFSAGLAAAVVILFATVRLIAMRRRTPPAPPAPPVVPKLLDLSDV
ncbi:MAG TPA: hypothetical protein VJ776_04425 [Thermoanaerobaculia bacterium]|nr:hypothetical protein [Thermoanaerobaculia bacterium]